MTAAEIIERLNLQPHPEGGHYVRTFEDTVQRNGRACSTAIYFLLQAGEVSHWHKVDAAEVWHFHSGATLVLRQLDGDAVTAVRLGMDLPSGERPQAIVPAGVWQSACTTGEWTLVSCTVAPGFRFENFELAPQGWEPSS